MEDFFARIETRTHPWPAGRRDLHWHLLPADVDQGRQLIDDYGEVVHYPGLEMVPPRWLHVTVLHAGPRDETSDEEITEITKRVRAAVAGTGPIELTFARPSVGNVAIERAARPGEPARLLWEKVWKATTSVVGEDRCPLLSDTYYPHTSIAYAGHDAGNADRGGLKALLSDTPGDEVTLSFPALTLVSQWHSHARIVWAPLATVPLT